MNFSKSKMKICDYEVSVSLGCSLAEQSLVQPVLFNIHIEIKSTVIGEKSDRLEDAIDYVELTDLVKKTAQKKSYHLIEHMNSEVSNQILALLRSKKISGILSVSLLKLRPPVENLKSGVEWITQTEI